MTSPGGIGISRAHLTGMASLVLALALAPFSLAAAVLPLVLFLVTCLIAPFSPTWSYFLETFSRGPTHQRRVALTFDDGPDPSTLGPLLEVLRREGVKATFFVVGKRVAEFPGGVARILAEGHTIGNHSWSHDPLLMLRGEDRLEREVRECQKILALQGVVPLVFRPPVGITNPRLPAVLRRLRLRCVTFRVRPLDFSNTRLEGLAQRMLRRIAPGDLVMLHDVSPGPDRLENWLAEVREILAGLRTAGLAVVPLEDLLGIPVMERVSPAELPPTEASSFEPARARVSAILSGALSTLIFLGYPALAYFGLAHLGARSAALLLLLAVAASQLPRVIARPGALRGLAWLGLAVGALLGLAALLDDSRFILAYPALVNFVLLSQFGWSLRSPPPMVERFARLQVDDLDATEARYCRTVTQVWCGFFLFNGTAAALLAFLGSREWWALYTGLVAYLLMGSLFTVEYVVRKARFGRFGPGLLDQSLLRVLRPGSSR
jgi:uncharacterized membrane protein/peptidoglycan/xylan/chitin deacetylase (PgdA/CDA1 family)